MKTENGKIIEATRDELYHSSAKVIEYAKRKGGGE